MDIILTTFKIWIGWTLAPLLVLFVGGIVLGSVLLILYALDTVGKKLRKGKK